MTDAPAVVTGVPGWLGNNFVKALLEGLPDVPSLAVAEPRPISVLVSDGDHPFVQKIKSIPSVRCVKGDVRNRGSLSPLFENAAGGTLFHIAGVVHPNKVPDFYAVNTEGTRSLVEMAVRAGMKRFVHISSNSPLGMNPTNKDVFDERALFNPYQNYGKSKMLAEQIVQAASSHIETVILRPPWFYGPGQPARQLLFFTMIRTGKVPLVGDGQNKRSMAYVDNISQGMLLAEKCDAAKSQTYWIADRKPYTMNEIIETIELVMKRDFSINVEHKRMRLPGIASEVALVVDTAMQTAGLYHQKIHVLSEMNKTIACSIAKAEKDLGYDPKIALEEGMRRSMQSALDEGLNF